MNPRLRTFSRAALALSVAVLHVFLSAFGAQAQVSNETWSPPQELFREKPGEYTNELWLLRDPADSLYLWWPVFPEDTNGMTPNEIQSASSVFHTEWQDGRWQEPRDILIWPKTGLNLTSAVIDSHGIVHAFSPTDCLSYTSAPHDQAMNPGSWSEQTCVDFMGSSNIAVALDDDDVLYLAYAAPSSQAIRVAASTNGGLRWTTKDVATTQNYDGPSDGYFTAPDLSIDERGRLHLVWSPASPPAGYPLLGVLYSRSDDGGQTWTTPVQLGQEREGQPAIAVHGDEVHVLWNGDAAKRGRYYRYSNDAGSTWKPVEKLGNDGGLQRPPALVVDNKGNLHAMLHEQESLNYIAKINNQWTAKTAVYSPAQENAAEVFAIRLAITGGNQLHALYTLLTNDGRRTIRHQQLAIDANLQTPVPGPTTPSTSTPVAVTSSAEGLVTATSTPIPDPLLQTTSSEAPTPSQSYPVLVGASTALVFVLGAIVVYGARHRR